MGPRLIAFVGGVEVARVAPPADMRPRSWVLGVMAVQATVERGQPVARLRIHLTGAAAPQLVALPEPACVAIAFVDEDPSIPSISAAPPSLAPGEAAALTLSLNGAPIARAPLLRDALAASPPPRAFAHVFCRWLRDGAPEPGCDLTHFLSIPEGTKFERVASRPIAAGDVIGIGWAAAEWP